MRKGTLSGALALAIGLVATNAMADEKPAYRGEFSACTKDGKQGQMTLAAYPGVDFGEKAADISRSILQQFFDQLVNPHTADQIRKREISFEVYVQARQKADQLFYRDMPTGVATESQLVVTGESCVPK